MSNVFSNFFDCLNCNTNSCKFRLITNIISCIGLIPMLLCTHEAQKKLVVPTNSENYHLNALLLLPPPWLVWILFL
ncbi:hypothetical protein Patl1_16246 [Pistacia atlantica]|uniref:Uncharacterized protein n=1 Tax=Pistacia atlantica TaxID=434234 RepID=A0ACC1B780_9ROSI|nr:hypothetical protein Patl1_16246 [Pistacia atlantica]